MPNTKSAKKDLRQNANRRLKNRAERSALRRIVKNARAAATADDPEVRDAALRLAAKKVDQAAAKRLIHCNKAARIKSHLAKLFAKNSVAAETSAEA